MVINAIKLFSRNFLDKIKDKNIHVVSHFDTDGITSAAIMSKTLERLNKQFSVKIIKQLTQEEINQFPENKLILLLDLGSGFLEELSQIKNEVIVIDHHEVKPVNSEDLLIFNPHLLKNYENLCSAELTYLISTEISKENESLSSLAVIGMVGDTMEKQITPTRNIIITSQEVKVKKGLLIYPSTRPVDKTLEYSSRPFIKGVTGNSLGTFELLKEANIGKNGRTYKALIDLTETEMKNLSTAIILRTEAKEIDEYIGNLYLIKLFNKLEDAREISAIINACSRMDKPEIGLMMLMGSANARKKAERIYVSYRQSIISGLKIIEKNEKIQGTGFVLINAKDQIKDTLIGTMASILSFSKTYKEGTIIVAMAYNDDKIKVSARIVGKNSCWNLKDLIESATSPLNGISGGHKEAAGCTIDKEHEDKFIELITKQLEFERVRV